MNLKDWLLAIAVSCLFVSTAVAVVPTQAECLARVKIDLESDGRLDCVAVQMVGTDAILKVRLSGTSDWIELSRYAHSDEVLSVVSLADYGNSKFKAPRRGYAIRLTFPGKSSVLYYWDVNELAPADFWESD